MTTSKKYTFHKWLREAERWGSDPFNRKLLLDGPQSNIETIIESGNRTRDAIGSMSIQLGYVAHWYAMQGAVRICQNDSSGWKDLYEGIRCLAVTRQVELAQVIGLTSDPALILVFALAVSDRALADRMVSTIETAITSYPGHAYNEIGFEPFALWLYSQATGSQPSSARFDEPESKDCYRSLIATWREPRALRNELTELCDVHLEYALGRSKHSNAQFPQPFDICPVEIVVIQRLRLQQGLAVEAIDHPLMASPLASLPTSTPEHEHDSFVERAIAQIRCVYPDMNVE